MVSCTSRSGIRVQLGAPKPSSYRHSESEYSSHANAHGLLNDLGNVYVDWLTDIICTWKLHDNGSLNELCRSYCRWRLQKIRSSTGLTRVSLTRSCPCCILRRSSRATMWDRRCRKNWQHLTIKPKVIGMLWHLIAGRSRSGNSLRSFWIRRSWSWRRTGSFRSST